MSLTLSMPKWLALMMLALALPLTSASPGTAQDEDDYGGLPQGNGREEVAAYCSVCHSLDLVKQQQLSRDSWAKLLVWMREEQGMAELPQEDEKLILDYLAEHLGQPERRRKF